MKAIIRASYGPPEVVQFAEVAKPSPADNEVLIKLRAASVNPVDLFCMRGAPLMRSIPGLRTPKVTVLGCDVAGRVEAVGRNAKDFMPGDEVFGVTGFAGGGFAEYVCASQDKLALKPTGLSFEEAAAVPIAGITALQGLRDQGQIQPGQNILLEGASGGVGTFAVQIARSFGAEVTAVCSTRNVATARSLGADHIIDYTQEDFAQKKQRYDLILAANAHHSIADYMRALNPDGIYVAAGGGVLRVLQAVALGPLMSRIGRRKVRFFLAKINRKDLLFLKALLEAGKVVPIIDKRYPLSAGADALRYLEEGHAQGKIVLSVQ